MSHYRRANRLGTQGWRNKELENKGVSVTIPKSPWEEDNGEKTMGFKLGKRSLERLEGVDERMVAVVKHAIAVTKQDFSVICGLRDVETQRKLVASGASQTIASKHIPGLAVDLMAYDSGSTPAGRWELNLYDEIADAMAEGARNVGVGVCWGAAWSTEENSYPMDIRYWEGMMEKAMNAYVDKKRKMGKRAFIDGPHFELIA